MSKYTYTHLETGETLYSNIDIGSCVGKYLFTTSLGNRKIVHSSKMMLSYNYKTATPATHCGPNYIWAGRNVDVSTLDQAISGLKCLDSGINSVLCTKLTGDDRDYPSILLPSKTHKPDKNGQPDPTAIDNCEELCNMLGPKCGGFNIVNQNKDKASQFSNTRFNGKNVCTLWKNPNNWDEPVTSIADFVSQKCTLRTRECNVPNNEWGCGTQPYQAFTTYYRSGHGPTPAPAKPTPAPPPSPRPHSKYSYTEFSGVNCYDFDHGGSVQTKIGVNNIDEWKNLYYWFISGDGSGNNCWQHPPPRSQSSNYTSIGQCKNVSLADSDTNIYATKKECESYCSSIPDCCGFSYGNIPGGGGDKGCNLFTHLKGDPTIPRDGSCDTLCCKDINVYVRHPASATPTPAPATPTPAPATPTPAPATPTPAPATPTPAPGPHGWSSISNGMNCFGDQNNMPHGEQPDVTTRLDKYVDLSNLFKKNGDLDGCFSNRGNGFVTYTCNKVNTTPNNHDVDVNLYMDSSAATLKKAKEVCTPEIDCCGFTFGPVNINGNNIYGANLFTGLKLDTNSEPICQNTGQPNFTVYYRTGSPGPPTPAPPKPNLSSDLYYPISHQYNY